MIVPDDTLWAMSAGVFSGEPACSSSAMSRVCLFAFYNLFSATETKPLLADEVDQSLNFIKDIVRSTPRISPCWAGL